MIDGRRMAYDEATPADLRGIVLLLTGLGNNLKGSRLLLYPNTSHIVIIERAEDFNRDVLTFLKN